MNNIMVTSAKLLHHLNTRSHPPRNLNLQLSNKSVSNQPQVLLSVPLPSRDGQPRPQRKRPLFRRVLGLDLLQRLAVPQVIIFWSKFKSHVVQFLF